MRLTNPGAGEISDRLTILALKRHFGAEANKDITHFNIEWGTLLSQIRTKTLNGRWFESLLELAVVNSVLWHAEDALRDLRKQYGAIGHDPAFTDQAVVRLAFRIQALNDQRAELVAQINKDAGDNQGDHKEKL